MTFSELKKQAATKYRIEVRIPGARSYHPLLCVFPGRNRAQDAFVHYAPDQRLLVADYASDDSTPESVFHALALRWTIAPNIRREDLLDVIAQILPQLDAISAGFSSYWNDGDMMGRYTDAASSAIDQVEIIIREKEVAHGLC